MAEYDYSKSLAPASRKKRASRYVGRRSGRRRLQLPNFRNLPPQRLHLQRAIGLGVTGPPSALPIAALAISGGVRGMQCPERFEPVYGGYANERGDIVLFAKEIAFHVNFRNQILKQRPQLNFGAQARYDAAAPGEDFAYGKKMFRRLSRQQIADICQAGDFRIGSRF